MTSLFAGVLNKSSSSVINVGAKMCVMDPALQTIASSIGMPDDVKLARANLALGGGWDDQK